MRGWRVLSHLFFLLASLSAWSASSEVRLPVQSLQDLPWKWEGVAGDLVVRVPATLVIEKIIKTSPLDPTKPLPALYDVEASFRLGSRKVAVRQIRLSAGSSESQAESLSLEITLVTGDELVPHLFATLRQDPVSQVYSLKELASPPSGRRLILTAQAR